MIYGTEPDYAALERAAWQRGDAFQAEVYQRALEAQYKLEQIDALITAANWRTGKKAELRELGDAIYNVLRDTA